MSPQREARAEPPPPPSSSVILARFAGRPVTTGRRIHSEFFDQEGFRLREWIQRQGWEYLCSLDVMIYPGLVQEFYAFLKTGMGGLVSEVRGVRIRVSEESLSELLHLPCIGATPEKPENKMRALQLIMENENFDFSMKVIASSLSAEMRLLFSIINRILFPKTGRFDLITERDLAVMECMIQGIPLNLPAMILRQMRKVMCNSRVSLPYGMILTLIFRQHGLALEEEASKSLHHTDTYTARTLIRMGYEKVNGQWIHTGAGIQGEAPEGDAPEDEDEEPMDHPTVPSEAGPSSSAPPTDTDDFWSRMTELMTAQARTITDGLTSRLDARLDVMSAEISDLRQQIGALRRERETHGPSVPQAAESEISAQSHPARRAPRQTQSHQARPPLATYTRRMRTRSQPLDTP